MEDGTYDAVLQLLEVKARKLKSGSYVYDCSFSDNTKKSIWEADEAHQITELKGGPAFPVRYSVKKSGKFTNMNVVAFALPGEDLPFDPEAKAAPAPETVAAETATPTAQKGGGGGGNWDEATVARVSKLACIEHASTLIASIYQGAGPEAVNQALADVKRVGKELYDLARRHEVAAAAAQPVVKEKTPEEKLAEAEAKLAALEAQKITPTATTPAEVAAGVPGVVVGTGAAETTPAGAATGSVDWD